MEYTQHRCSPILAWVEHTLRADRHAVDLALALRHASLLEELAPHLEGLDWKGPSSKKMLLDSADPGAANAVTSLIHHSAERPSPGRGDPPPPRSPSTICSFELHCDNEEDSVPTAEEPFVLSPAQQQQQQQLQQQHGHLVKLDVVSEKSPTAAELSQLHYRKGLTLSIQRELRTPQPAEGSCLFCKKERRFVRKLLASQWSDVVSGLIIVGNSVCIGFESSFEVQGRDPSVFQTLEHAFMTFYVCELLLQFFANGRSCLRNSWVVFDLVLVCTGVLSTYVVGPIVSMSSTNGDDVQDKMDGLLVLRLLRLFRLARAVRALVIFRDLRLLVGGFMASASTIGYTFILITLILFIFSCLSLELITKRLLYDSPSDVQFLVQSQFSTLSVTMLTLVQFVNGDSMASIYFPLILHDPILVLLFVPFMLFLSISMMNVVTAVIVEGALEKAKQDQEAQTRYQALRLKKMLPALKAMFHEIDEDGNGLMTLQELACAPEEVQEKLKEVIKANSPVELFEMLDVDESGAVDIDDFCDGVVYIVNSDTPTETIRILGQLSTVRRQLRRLLELSGADVASPPAFS